MTLEPEILNSLSTGGQILLVNLAGIGDLVLATPTFRDLKQHFPKCNLYLLSASHSKGLLNSCPFIDQHFFLHSTRSLQQWGKSFFKDQKILKELRNKKINAGINMYTSVSWAGSLRMAFYFHQIKPAFSIGFNRGRKGWFYNKKINQSNENAEQMHQSKQYAVLSKSLGIPVISQKPELWISKGEKEKIKEKYFLGNRFDAQNFIVMVPNSGIAEKAWSPEKFGQLGAWITKHFKISIVLDGDKKSLPVVQKAATYLPKGKFIITAGQTTLRDLIALTSISRMAICNDSGLMHLASALKKPFLSFFLPSNLERFTPLTSNIPRKIICSRTDDINDISLEEAQNGFSELWESSLKNKGSE